MRELLSSLISTRTAEEQAKSLATQVNSDLKAIRERIMEVDELIEKATQAPADRKFIEARATRIVDHTLHDLRSKIGILDYLAAPASRYKEAAAFGVISNLSAFEFAALTDRNSLIESLTCEAVAAGGDIGPALSELNREKTISKLRNEAQSLSAAEELLLRTLETVGAKAPRRANADTRFLTADNESLQRLAEAAA